MRELYLFQCNDNRKASVLVIYLTVIWWCEIETKIAIVKQVTNLETFHI